MNYWLSLRSMETDGDNRSVGLDHLAGDQQNEDLQFQKGQKKDVFNRPRSLGSEPVLPEK